MKKYTHTIKPPPLVQANDAALIHAFIVLKPNFDPDDLMPLQKKTQAIWYGLKLL